jgi:hypothetical protein
MNNDADPNENSNGLSALQSLNLVDNDKDLRVPYYCEENVWRLATRKIQEQPQNDYFVCFITNYNKTVLMCHQRAAGMNCPVVWDYHVILLAWHRNEQKAYVYDVDSRLSYPLDLMEYLGQSFPNATCYPEEYHPHFRIIYAPLYLQCFSSNRMHMYNTQRRAWNAPLPPYQCIQGTSDDHGAIALQQYLDLNASDTTKETSPNTHNLAYGHIVSLEGLLEFDFRATGKCPAENCHA